MRTCVSVLHTHTDKLWGVVFMQRLCSHPHQHRWVGHSTRHITTVSQSLSVHSPPLSLPEPLFTTESEAP